MIVVVITTTTISTFIFIFIIIQSRLSFKAYLVQVSAG
jgi:hypothetical protein